MEVPVKLYLTQLVPANIKSSKGINIFILKDTKEQKAVFDVDDEFIILFLIILIVITEARTDPAFYKAFAH